ncbi:hypothetical protein CO615_09240 [Lysobacteraceae bacterium NML75-0749]|nr:hypothetical protein CO615_09240 [Xanthomonadaceae bacterium NML75-0749]PJK05540.1 hypothetical protein CO609_00810 [Xanthomonadaceae bacterium NML91-0268]
MNKIYRLVWNRETGTMVVASELAKSDGGRTVGGVLASPRLVISALASALLLAVGGHAMAADGQKHPISGGSGDNYCYYDSASHSVICGDGSTSVADTYDGKQAKSVAIGVSATTTGESNVALGANSSASHTSGLAIGAKTKAHNNQTIAIGENATSMGEVDIMIGKSAGLNNTATSSTGRNIGIGEGAVSSAVNANNVIGIGTGAATGIDGSHIVAIGTDANKGIKTQSSVAVGYKATSPGTSSVAVGNAAKSDGTTAVAVGFEATTSGNNAVAVGKTAKAGGASVAIGANTVATQAATVAVGSGAKTGNQRAIAIGENADGAGTHTVAIGRAATSSGVSAIAIGGTQSEATKTQASGDYSIALGAQSTLAKSENTVAIGRKAAAAGNNTVSLGAESGSIGVEADAAGSLANVNARTKAGKTSANGLVNMTNIGYKAGAGNINNNYGVNIGYEAGAGGYNSFYGEGVSIGNKAGGVNTGNATVKAAMETASQVHGGVAAGVIITGNTNTAISSRAGVNALGHDNVAIGKDAGGYSSGNSNIAIGRHAGRVSVLNTSGVRVIDENAFSATRNTIALGEWAHGAANETIAIGSLARVEEKGLKSIPNSSGGYTNVDSESLNAMAVGHGAVAKGDSAIALGASSRVDFMNSIAMGAKAAALSYNSTAIGVEAKTKGYSSIAIGDKAEAGTQHADATPATNFAIAIGTSSKATGETSVALGSNAQATTFRGTALGVLSEVKVNNGVALGASSVASRDRYQNGVDPLGAKDTGAHASVWTSTHGAVSVGDAENTDPSKRITRQITGVAAGSADTDAVNVAQLKAAGFKLTTSKSGTGEVHGDTLEKVQNGETLTIDAGDNISLTQAANKITVATKKDVAFDKVTVGGVTIDKASNKVSGLAAGDVNASSTDAVNGSQLFATNQNVAANTAAINTLNTTVVKPITFAGDTGTDVSRKLGETVNIVGGVGSESLLTDANIGVVGDGTDTLEIKLAKDLVGLESAHFDDGSGNETEINGKGLTIANADPTKVVSLTSAGLNNGGNQITNVASGGDVDTNAANIGDVKAAAAKATTKVDAGDNIEVASTTNADGSTTYTVATKKDVTFDSVTAGGNTLDANGLAIAGGPIISVSGIDMAGKKISNLADGTEDGDAVNFSQLKAVQTLVNAGWTVTDASGNAAKIGPNGVVTFSSADSNISVAQTGADQAGKVEITLNRNLDLDSVTAGGNKLDANGLAIAGGPTISATGIDMGGKKISNLGDGTEEGDAVNLGQLKSYVGEETAKVKTHYYSVNDGGTKGGNYDNDGATGNGAIAAGVDTTATAENAVAMGKGAAASHAGSVALGAGAQTQAVDNTGTFMLNGGTAAGVNAVAVVSVGSKGNERRIVNVAAGRLSADSTDAVNGSQLFAVGTAVNNLGNATALALGGNTTYTPGGGLSVNLTVGGNTYTNVQDALNAVSGGGTGATKVVAGTNTQVTQNGDTYTVSVVDNPVVDGKATFNGGIEVAGGQSVNMGGNVVRNVAAGVADTDAVNVGQLNGAIAGANAYTDGRFNQLANDMWQIDRGYRGATASAMAMAGLPQAYLPGKSMFSAAVGGYRGEYGLAFGLSGITDNGKWVYKAQASGNTARDWGFSAGVGVQW